MAQKVPVGKDGLFALVDDEDYALVSQYKWYIVNGYAKAHTGRQNGKDGTLQMHRLILGLGSGDLRHIDHANHDGLDNRRCNFRLATPAQNNANSRKQRRITTSQYKGVAWRRREQQWCAGIGVHGKKLWLGYFDNESEAARAYDSAAVQFFGEYALLNFPGDTPAPYIRSPRRKGINVSYSATQAGQKKWRAEIKRNGKRHWIGWFLTEADAIAALQTYKRKHGL